MPPIAAACDAERAACKWCSYVLMVKSRALLGDARQQQAKESGVKRLRERKREDGKQGLRENQKKRWKCTHILFTLFDASIDLGDVPVELIVYTFELVFSEDGKRLAIIQFPLPESLRPCHGDRAQDGKSDRTARF